MKYYMFTLMADSKSYENVQRIWTVVDTSPARYLVASIKLSKTPEGRWANYRILNTTEITKEEYDELEQVL